MKYQPSWKWIAHKEETQTSFVFLISLLETSRALGQERQSGSPIKSCTVTPGGGGTLRLSVCTVTVTVTVPTSPPSSPLDSVSPRDWDKCFQFFSGPTERANTCKFIVSENLSSILQLVEMPPYMVSWQDNTMLFLIHTIQVWCRNLNWLSILHIMTFMLGVSHQFQIFLVSNESFDIWIFSIQTFPFSNYVVIITFFFSEIPLYSGGLMIRLKWNKLIHISVSIASQLLFFRE